MKFYFYLFFGAFISFGLSAQPATPNIGTKTLYHAPAAKLTPPPTGYEPVFINHVGRHGARHLTKPVATTKGYLLLMQASEANALTTTGKRLKILLQRLDTLEQKDVKSISAEGVVEQQGIAARMYQQYKLLFSHHATAWKAAITKEIRTKQTAAAFINELKKRNNNQDSITYTVNDTTLRFYDLAPAYNLFEDSGSWQTNVMQLKRKLKYEEVVNAVCHRIFSAFFVQQLLVSQKEDFVSDVYGFYTILFSLKNEIDAARLSLTANSLQSFFTYAQLNQLGQLDRSEDYFQKGPGTNAMGIQVKIAAPLLADFLSTTDAFIRSGTTPVKLRFSHAETIIPFAALLQLNGADKAVKSGGSFTDAVWNAAEVAPLSSNIQWILYKQKSSGQYLMKCLLNEKEVSITGLETKMFPYYNWEKVQAFYLNKLQQLNFKASDSPYQYLQNLK